MQRLTEEETRTLLTAQSDNDTAQYVMTAAIASGTITHGPLSVSYDAGQGFFWVK